MKEESKIALFSSGASEPVGPYSQGVVSNSIVFISGQLGIDLKKKRLVETVEDQTRLALNSVKAIVSQAGGTLDDIVKTTILLADMNDFGAVNGVYAQFFSEPYPARAAYQVVKLPLGAMVEIEAVAILKER